MPDHSQSTAPPLGGLSPAEFLRQYWQRRPLLVRQGLPGFSTRLSADELAGLACDADLESRLVVPRDGDRRWVVQPGPLDGSTFARLPEREWTLLLQDVDKWLPAVAELLERFRFLPVWRLDDVMISYAADGGSLGPRWDACDMFLIQVEGRGRWAMATEFDADDLVQDADLRVLREFRAEREWLLEPGDVLYLPPGVAHHGVAEGPGITCSVGFRAPTLDEMLPDLCEFLLQQGIHWRFADPWREDTSADPGRLDGASLAEVRKAVRDALTVDDDTLDDWFGRFITEPRPWLRPAPPESPLALPELLAQAARTGGFERHSMSCLSHAQTGYGRRLFVDGDSRSADDVPDAVLRILCGSREIPYELLKPYLDVPAVRELLAELHRAGAIMPRQGL